MSPVVSVIFSPGYDEELRAISLASVENQTLTDWEVVTDLARATGEYVAFLDAGDSWVPDRLERLIALRKPLVADELEGERGNGDRVVFRTPAPDVEPARLVARREALLELGPVDPALPVAWLLDLLMRHDTEVERVSGIGVRRRFPDRRRALRPPPGDWRRVVLNRHLVDWAALEARTPTTGLTSVIVPTYDDSELTTACIESLLAAEATDHASVEVIVWDNGSSPEVAAVLDRLAGGRVQVHHSPENHGFALGNNLALAQATGDVVVFLNNDTTVPPGWLAPLLEALTDEDVLGAQPLLLYPTGSIQSAGVAFPTCGGLPHAFLRGFPAEDAYGVEGLRFQALTGAALALRFSDAVALRGFDPVFANGMEDVDLCHRLRQLRQETTQGHFRVLDSAPVVHHESGTPGRHDKHLANRTVYLDRWQQVVAPRDDAALWATRGMRVVDHDIGKARHGAPPRLRVPRPVLVREARLQVTEAPRLRWAIKNAAPAGPGGERWGDTHFAASLAAALRDHGQEVVVDRRPEWDRPTGRHDDVVLVLRGLVRHDPSPEQVSLLWVISHPEVVTRDEAHGYDRVLAAGQPWAERRARDWALRIEPLLQATDPERFHPDAGIPGTGDPVLFVGNSRRQLRPVVRDALAAGLPLAVYGDLWSGLVPDEVVQGRSIPNDQLAAAYRSAGIVLNDHHDAMRADGFVSNRLFDAVASGARVVTDEVAGLAELFGPGVQVYETPDDLARLATLADPDSVFGDDATRRAAADRVRTQHSFAARAARLIEVAHEARAERSA